ncbi:cytochrome c peroxidase [soil metagenome]
MIIIINNLVNNLLIFLLHVIIIFPLDKVMKNRYFFENKIPFTITIIAFILLLNFTLSSYRNESGNLRLTETIKKNLLQDLSTFGQKCEHLTYKLELLYQQQIELEEVQEVFHQLKKTYKKTEYLIEYLDPDIAKNINGAPIPKVAIDHQPYLALNITKPAFVTFLPEGLQVLEEILFAEDISSEAIKDALSLTYRMNEKIKLFHNNLLGQILTDKQILESLREQIIRLMTMGITGFDTPAAGETLQNAKISIEPVLQVLMLYHEISSGDEKVQITQCINYLEQAIDYLQQNQDFDSFDRLFFTREIADPAYGAVTLFLHLKLKNKESNISKPVNDLAISLFNKNFLHPEYYAKQDQLISDPELIGLGKFLFFDPVLSSNNQRSCSSCHDPARAFTDGRKQSLAFNPSGNLQRNSPTLINSIFSAAYFWDSRVQYLQDQVPDVVNKVDELHGSYDEVVKILNQSKEYKSLFKKVFPEPSDNSITVNKINRAIAAYVQSLVALNAPFDKYMRKETSEYTLEADRGFNLFMGKASCGTCHFPPVFSGTVPPRYIESETEVLGVPTVPDFKFPVLDTDSGRAGVVPAEFFLHSFKTPTVRNIELTAPYMHNGSFSTLEEVIEFYDLGGGTGIGLDVPNQTLPPDPLNLSPQEKQDIIAFMLTLTDTTHTTSIPHRLPSFSKNSPLNKRKVGGNY